MTAPDSKSSHRTLFMFDRSALKGRSEPGLQSSWRLGCKEVARGRRPLNERLLVISSRSLEYRQADVKWFGEDGATILENSLTASRRSAKVIHMQKDGLKTYLLAHLGDDPSKTHLARVTGLPYYILVDIFRGKTQRPDPSVLERLSLGLHLDYDELALAAYGNVHYPDPAGADDTSEDGSPPASNRSWKQTGKPLRRASAATF